MTTHGTQYDRLEEIGRSQSAVLYDGYDSEAGREVVIMELDEQFRADDGRWSEIWQQALRLAGARLPNVVPVYDAIEQQRWIVSEKMRGDLAETACNRALTGEEVRGVLKRTLVALAAVHEQNVIHGDVNPRTLQYDPEGLIQLSFSPGLIFGEDVPPHEQGFKYLPPETWTGRFGTLGPTADLYSLGFVAAELLVGPRFASHIKTIAPAEAESELAWRQWHVAPEQTLPSLSALVPAAPQDLVHVIDRLVRKPVHERYASAVAALQDLAPQPVIEVLANDQRTRSAPSTLPTWSRSGSAGAEEVASADGGFRNQTPHELDDRKPRAEPLRQRLLEPKTLFPSIAVIGTAALLFAFADRDPPDTPAATVDTSGNHPKFQRPLTPVNPAQRNLPVGLEAEPGAKQHGQLQLPVHALSTKTIGTDHPLRFVLVAAAEFPFGAQSPVQGELEQRMETVDQPFYLTATEVSNAQFALFARERRVSDPEWMAAAAGLREQGAAYPVRNVSRSLAHEFCRWLSETGRLPTEIEWELAAREGTDRPFPWGVAPQPSADLCNLAFGGDRQLQPAGTCVLGATSTGIRDLIGNVAEWCDESYVAGFGDERAQGVGKNPVIRGGSYKEDPALRPIRVTTRANVSARGADDVGFRVLIPAIP